MGRRFLTALAFVAFVAGSADGPVSAASARSVAGDNAADSQSSGSPTGSRLSNSSPLLPIGIQAWSEHVTIDADMAAGYRALAQYGVRSVELYGIDGPKWEALPQLLAANRLTAISALIGLDPLIADPAGMIQRARVLGLRYLGVGWIKSERSPVGGLTVADADRAAAAFNALCPAIRAAGITPILHLHGYELVADPSGSGTMLDRILARVPARCLSVEIDVFWVRHAGGDPIALLRKLGPRVALLHLKDPAPGMPIDDSGAVSPGHERALGEGTVDWPALLAEAKAQGVQAAFIEDETGDPATNVPRSVAYLRRIGAIR